MFDFPQPGEIYRSAGFPDVAVVGILEDGIPWEMPYRCPEIVWNPYRRKFSILVRILADGRTTDIPLGRFLREFTCDRPDLFKRSPVNRHAVLKEMAGDPELQKMAGEISGYLPAGHCSGQPGGTGGAGMAGNSPHGA